MATISESEKLRRRQAVKSVLGTNNMEGIFLDAPTLALMRRFEEGEIEIDELSAAIDLHVAQMPPSPRRSQVPAGSTAADAA